MAERGHVYQSHERAIERVFQLGLAVTSLEGRTADPHVQERLAGIAVELDEVIAELRSVTFDDVLDPALTNAPPDAMTNAAPDALADAPPGSAANGLPAA